MFLQKYHQTEIIISSSVLLEVLNRVCLLDSVVRTHASQQSSDGLNISPSKDV